MASKVLDLQATLQPERIASQISDNYRSWKLSRGGWEAQKAELRNYVFAIDTTTTTNASLPWKNKTTRPKLCQIRDNLHANYMAALFPNDNWFKWDAGDEDSASKDKARAVVAYMQNKFRESKFKEIVSRYVYDYIDWGNVFGDVEYAEEVSKDNTRKGYIGPRAVRISPLDIVFDITAPSFEQAPKITRSLLSFGQIEKLRQSNPDWKTLAEDVFDKIKYNRKLVAQHSSSLDVSDYQKVQGYVADGFNTLREYYSSGMVEFLEFEGDLFDPNTGKLLQDHVITIVDRLYVVRSEPINNWFAKTHKRHCGWRFRPDNLMAMGPLDNLVGLQYRIDHLENLKADVFDLIAFPVLKVKGYVEDFKWGPAERIIMDDEADVEHLAPDTTALTADMEIARLEQTMEEMAGAPKQAMGIRTPGEKTAFEVQQLENASSRVFQAKISYFEEHFLEPLMNSMLETARRHVSGEEVIKIVDDDIGVEEFLTISPQDLKSKGRIVPMGARHFASQAQLVQNLANLTGTGLYNDPDVVMHLSSKKLAELIQDNLNLSKYDVYSPYVRLDERAEAQSLAMNIEEQNQVESMTPLDGEEEEAMMGAEPIAPGEEEMV